MQQQKKKPLSYQFEPAKNGMVLVTPPNGKPFITSSDRARREFGYCSDNLVTIKVTGAGVTYRSASMNQGQILNACT